MAAVERKKTTLYLEDGTKFEVSDFATARCVLVYFCMRRSGYTIELAALLQPAEWSVNGEVQAVAHPC